MADSNQNVVTGRTVVSPLGTGRTDVLVGALAFLAASAVIAAYIWYGVPTEMRAGLGISAALGAACGWVLGIFAAPYSESRGNWVGEFVKITLAIVAGYSWARFDDIAAALTPLLDPESAGLSNVPYVAVAVIMFVVTLGATVLLRNFSYNRRALRAGLTVIVPASDEIEAPVHETAVEPELPAVPEAPEVQAADAAEVVQIDPEPEPEEVAAEPEAVPAEPAIAEVQAEKPAAAVPQVESNRHEGNVQELHKPAPSAEPRKTVPFPAPEAPRPVVVGRPEE